MDKEPDLSKKEPEAIRSDIEETRSSLTAKLETLEQEVKETVTGAKEAVTDTVEAVKETVQDTVESVKGAFDVSGHARRHPWAWVGGSFVAGFVVGTFAPRVRVPAGRGAGWSWGGGSSTTAASFTPRPDGRSAAAPQPLAAAAAAPKSEEPGMISKLADKVTDQFDDEIQKLKGIAIGAALGFLRDLVTRNLPEQLAPRVRPVMDQITTKLGGEPFPEPLLPPDEGQLHPAGMGRSSATGTRTGPAPF